MLDYIFISRFGYYQIGLEKPQDMSEEKVKYRTLTRWVSGHTNFDIDHFDLKAYRR